MSDELTQAARLTVVFVLLYEVTFVNGVITKKRLHRIAQQEKKLFDRYNSPEMHNADRLQANFLEWSPVFLGLVWSLAATVNLSKMSIAASWLYLGLRAIYIVLVLQYGVASNGFNQALWVSTFPSYICLVFMTQEAIRFILL